MVSYALVAFTIVAVHIFVIAFVPFVLLLFQANLTLPSYECLPFHTAESRILLESVCNGILFQCSPFRLVPTTVPTSFQVELTPLDHVAARR